MATAKKKSRSRTARKAIPASAWKRPTASTARGGTRELPGPMEFTPRSPKFRVGDTVRTAEDVPYPDVVVPTGTTAVVTGVTEFGDEFFYFVVYDGDTIQRLVREAQLA